MKTAAFILLVSLLGIGTWAWWWMGRALYSPGDAVTLDLSIPGGLPQPDTWDVGDAIHLHHFSTETSAVPPWVAVHGGPGIPPSAPWPVANVMAPKQPWVFYHQRGCGLSTRPWVQPPEGNTWHKMQAVERNLGLAQHIADLERVRRHLQQDQLTLVGHSFGALVAALYAAEFPNRVKALILLAPANLVRMPNPNADLFEKVRTHLPVSNRAAYGDYLSQFMKFGTLINHNDAQLTAFWERFGAFYGAASGMVMPTKHQAPGGGFMPLAVYLSMGQHHDWEAFLQRVTAPTLVIHGALDLMPQDVSQDFAALIPQARFEVLEGAGHFMVLDQPTNLAAMLERFTRALPR